MLPIETFWGFLTGVIAYGGGASVIAYFVFQFLGKSWLENQFAKGLENFKHEKDIEIQKLRIEVESLLSGKIKLQERDFTILPEAWGKLHKAHMTLSGTVASYQEYPDLARRSKMEINEIVETLDAPLSAKERILNSADPTKEYREVLTLVRMRDVKRAIAGFKDYVDVNGIFLPSEMKSKFDSISSSLWDALVTKEVGHEEGDWKMQRESVKALEKEIRPKIKEIEAAINFILTSHAKSQFKSPSSN